MISIEPAPMLEDKEKWFVFDLYQLPINMFYSIDIDFRVNQLPIALLNCLSILENAVVYFA